jgi:threonine dehydrogenase-like Zn-dependent dehydrogenase
VIVTDRSDERLERIEERFGKLMKERGMELVKLNPSRGDDPEAYGPFDDIICLVPVPAIISGSIPMLAQDGVYNIFAGVARGVTSEFELGALLAKNGRLVGTSGSTIDDLKTTLSLVESDTVSFPVRRLFSRRSLICR